MLALVGIGALVMSACTATGGGTLQSACGSSATPSATAGPVATFGFAYDDVSGTFSGNLQDLCAGVNLTGAGPLAPTTQDPPAVFQQIAPGALIGCVAGTATYQSQNRANPGSGSLNIFGCGLSGQLQTAGLDFVSITVTSGPFVGYMNQGLLQQGSLVVR